MGLKEIKRDAFLKVIIGFVNQPYIWPTPTNLYSGKGLPGAMYKDCHDCSGTVTDGLYQASGGTVDWRALYNAQRLWETCIPTNNPTAGDLAFYGKGPQSISHVMVVLAKGVVGASGGDHTTVTPELAHARGAMVKSYPNHLYRDDFVGFGILLS